MKGTYISMKPMKMSVSRLKKFIGDVVDISKQELHVTIMYSYDRLEKEEEYILYQKSTKSAITSFEYWEGSGDGFLVAILDDQDLKDHHQYWKSKGLTSSHPEYKPHMTIRTPIDENYGEYIATILNDKIREIGILRMTFKKEELEYLK